MKRRTLFTLVLFCIVAPTASAFAESPAIFIGQDLKPTRVRLHAAGNGQVFYSLPDDNSLRDASLSAFPRILFPKPETDDPGVTSVDPRAGLITLVDGRRVAGRLVAGGDDESVAWEHRALGKMTFSLDDVRAIRLPVSAENAKPLQATNDAPAATDQLVLANGDRLGGFIVAIRASGVEIQPDGQDDAITLPLDRVARITLANPAPDDDAPNVDNTVWLRDGSRVRFGVVEVEGQSVLLSNVLIRAGGPTKPIRVPIETVRRIDVGLGGAHIDDVIVGRALRRIIDLTDLPRKVTAGGLVFGVPMPPTVESAGDTALAATNLRLHAPVTVQLDLPEGASRLAFVAELDTSNASAHDWADLDLTVRVDGTAVAQAKINGDSPRTRLNVKAGRRVELVVGSGANGPVLDRLRLRDAMIFVGSP